MIWGYFIKIFNLPLKDNDFGERELLPLEESA